MRRAFSAFGAVLLALAAGRTASAHRLDEYLQATLLTVEQDKVQCSMRLIPGASVASSVIAGIDTNGDGILSEAEQRTYAQHVLADLTLTADGHAIFLKIVSATFPQAEAMRGGLGEIHIQFTGALPAGGPHRTLTLENRHNNPASVYLVNATVPADPKIHILSQKRNEQQSSYELDYDVSGAPATNTFWSSFRIRTNAAAFASLFHLGMRHISEGTDHLLFLLALLLPAPLITSRSRWVRSPSVRPGMIRVLKIVTAFTAGHSLTLALAAMGVVHVPSRPIEVLIAVSILVSAIHALRPLFPGKEAAIAAFFGLIHGLAFASTLSNLGLGLWERLSGILAFNLGIEAMQLVVVGLALPPLILMSRTAFYPFIRIPVALFAALASIGWITERLVKINTPVDAVVNAGANHALVIACALCLVSLVCWRISSTQAKKSAISDPSPCS